MTKSIKPKKMGRPSKYSATAANEVCTWIISGKSLKSYCAQKGKPTVASVYRWLAASQEFRDLYARAREDQADTLADEIIDIADSESDPNKARVRVDARKWAASKLKPKKYGDKNNGGDADNPLHIQIVTGVPEKNG